MSAAQGIAEAAEGRTTFRGLAVGMTKTEILSANVGGFKATLMPAIKHGSRVILPAHVEFKASEGTTCADVILDANEDAAKALTLQECFFNSTGAKARDFAQKFADSYNIKNLVGSRAPLNKAVEEKYEGQTDFGEAVTISAVSAGINYLPIKVSVSKTMKDVSFD
jgi:4-aminobutyrate aminotransferase-like enzyme